MEILEPKFHIPISIPVKEVAIGMLIFELVNPNREGACQHPCLTWDQFPWKSNYPVMFCEAMLLKWGLKNKNIEKQNFNKLGLSWGSIRPRQLAWS